MIIRFKSLLATALLICCSSSYAQTIGILVNSNNPQATAMGDVAFLRPSMSQYRLSADINYGCWQPKYTASSVIGADVFYKAGKKAGFNVGFKYNLLPSYTSYDSGANPTGSFTPGQYLVSAGANLCLSDVLYVDVTAKFFSSKLAPNATASSFAGDVALMYSKKAFTAGVKASNLGTRYNYGGQAYSLPANVKVGGSYLFSFREANSLTLAFDAGYYFPKNFSSFVASVGADFCLKDLIFFRAGYHFSANQKAIPGYASFGLGGKFRWIAVNLTYLVSSAPAGGSILAGISVNLW